METTNRNTRHSRIHSRGNAAFTSAAQDNINACVYARNLARYEQQKSEIREQCLSAAEYESACRKLADMLGI